MPVDMTDTVYMMHMPPANIGLDVCRYGDKVGSIAIYQFLQTHQPKYSLHGHIHESPDVSGVWQALIGKTICVQPGQMGRYTYVIIDCLTNTVDRYED
jgi:Icc-related predicted phosphoesterase